MSFNARNLAWRVGVSIVGIPIILYAVLVLDRGVVALAAVLAFAAAWEWADLVRLRPMAGLYVVMIVGPVFLIAGMLVIPYAGWMIACVLVVVLTFGLALTGPWKAEGGVRAIGATIAGTLYIGLFALLLPISHWGARYGSADGRKMIVALLGMIWVGDTFAYFGGTALGRHRLAPEVSPKKSWEGAAFCFIGSMLGGAIAWYVLRLDVVGLYEMLGIGATVGIVGQIGDLAESLIKRDVGVKDSSNLLPGHGGVLDRFDSLLFSLPIIWGWLIVRAYFLGT